MKIKKMCACAILIALASVLSLVKVWEMPLGGSVTLMSMVPIVVIGAMYGVSWGLTSAFIYSVIQLFFGITMSGLFAWGLTPICLVGTIVLDYLLPFTLLGLVALFKNKTVGTAAVLTLRFLSHFASGYIIFANFEEFIVFGKEWVNAPLLYSVCYNGLYMLPELVITVTAVALIFKSNQIKKLLSFSAI